MSERLRSTLVRNTHMRVFVANGYYDLATPHFATEYTINHMGLKPETRRRIEGAVGLQVLGDRASRHGCDLNRDRCRRGAAAHLATQSWSPAALATI